MADTDGDPLWQVTRSSMLRRAVDAPPGLDRDAAWSELIDYYRHPISVCLHKRVFQHADCETIIEEFFTYLFTTGVIAKLDRAKGRFRVFLQAVMRNYVKMKAREYAGSAGDAGLDRLLVVDPPSELEADEERAWARSLFDRAVEQVEQANHREGLLLERLLGLRSHRPMERAELAESLGISRNALDKAYGKARKALLRRIDSQIAQLCDGEEDFEAEKQALIGRLLELRPDLFG